jgi:putative transcriptional regulator
MREERFQQLLQSLEEAAAHHRGEIDAARVTFLGEPDPREVRARAGMTREQFAAALGISRETLYHWEQGRRDPNSPAMARLKAMAENPEIARDAA